VTDGLSRLFAPRSVAVIGASSDPKRIGGRPIAVMLERGFKGTILPVNPNRTEIQGLKAYPTVAELPEDPDVAIVAVPAALVCETITELGKRGTSAAVVFSSGFAETGSSGLAEQTRMIEAANKAGIRILGPNTLGLFDLRTGFCGSFTSAFDVGYPPVGRIGVASQSGAYCGHIVSVMRNRGLGIAQGVMTGNEADITLGDAIAHMVADDGIDVIAVYAEGINQGERFVSALEAARQARKPVVVMRVGRTSLGSAAAKSHTAAIAGNDAVARAVLADCGAVEARTTEELLDIAQLATRRIYPAGNTLGVITISGGGGVVISDAAEELGLPMPEMPADAQKRLRCSMTFR
jgi:acyl-CoA synthetase (NDP forming)